MPAESLKKLLAWKVNLILFNNNFLIINILMVKKIKKNKEKTQAKAEAKTKKAKATATAKQKVIINIGKGGGGKGAGKARAPTRAPAQQQQQYQGPSHYDFGQLKSDIMENIGNKFNQFVEKKASDILNIPSTTSEAKTTVYDVAGLVTAGTGLLKSTYDIYKDYSEGERKMRKYKVPNVPIPTAQPVNPPNLENVISRQRPVPRQAIPVAPPQREEKEREEKRPPDNYLVPSISPPAIPRRPERRALPTAMERPPAPSPVAPAQAEGLVSSKTNRDQKLGGNPAFLPVRRKTPAEISTEQMLADWSERNKRAIEAQKANKPLIPFMNFVPRPERQALPTAIERKSEPQFSVGEEPKEIISGSVMEHKILPNFTNTYDMQPPQIQPRQVMPPSFLKRNLPEAIERRQDKRYLKYAVNQNKEMEESNAFKNSVFSSSDISNDQFIKNTQAEISKMKQDLKVNDILQQPVASPLARMQPVSLQPPKREETKPASIPAYLNFIKETKEAKEREEKRPPDNYDVPQQRGGPSRGQGRKPSGEQSEEQKLKAQKAKEAYAKKTEEQKQQKQIKQEELRARNKAETDKKKEEEKGLKKIEDDKKKALIAEQKKRDGLERKKQQQQEIIRLAKLKVIADKEALRKQKSRSK